MKQLDHQINLDRAVGAEDNASQGVTPMRNSSTKMPWFLRFAPGAILRQIGLAVLVVVVIILLNDVSAADSSTFPKGIHCYEKFGGDKVL